MLRKFLIIIPVLLSFIWSEEFELKDESKNTIPFDFLTLGELFQNNHHRFPSRINFAVRKFEIDPVYYIIRLFNKLTIIKLKK